MEYFSKMAHSIPREWENKNGTCSGSFTLAKNLFTRFWYPFAIKPSRGLLTSLASSTQILQKKQFRLAHPSWLRLEACLSCSSNLPQL
uniref:Uncharacterized protein n=1 Tax=Arundo donax TaxID=35708 RepID=A0A0A9A5G1_ARUDO